MYVLEITAGTLLLTESILAMACLVAAVQVRLAHGRRSPKLRNEISGAAGTATPANSELDAIVGQILHREEHGAVGLCMLLTKAAPLTGLAGMLGGVATALFAYAHSGNDPQQFIAGFSVSILATFWGVMIALVALFTARGIWFPYLTSLRNDLFAEGRRASRRIAADQVHSSCPTGTSIPSTSRRTAESVDPVSAPATAEVRDDGATPAGESP